MNRSDLELEVMLATENLEQGKTTTQQGITISTITRELQSKDKTFVSIDYPDLDVDEGRGVDGVYNQDLQPEPC